MSELSEKQKHADTIIRNHIIWSMGAGLIPVPIVDFFAVSGIQLDMIRQLCKLYDQDFKEAQGKAIITSLTGSGIARMGAKAMIKFIPGIGSIIGGVTMAVLSGASSFALGEVFKKHFETGGTFLDFDAKRLKKMYNEKFEKGKQVAEQINKEQEAKRKAADQAFENKTSGRMVDKLRELAELRKEGLITEEEFTSMKKKLIGE
ncbi:MAG TPA: DUF697 domain-containing protein [Saprospiraceae bacterium]|nr:DUF697 domain-containing protein [Saprospiraceae bacterium]HZV44455.1 DUF697 domain-containing protein [Saprospiraceae bacterium]